MFGRRARLPVDINTEAISDPNDRLKQYENKEDPDAEEVASKRRKLEETVKNNIEMAQTKQKTYYDKRFGAASCFKVGSKVFVKDFTRKKRKGGKLDTRWLGSYIVTTALGKGLFELKAVEGSKVCNCWCHCVVLTVKFCAGHKESQWIPSEAMPRRSG